MDVAYQIMAGVGIGYLLVSVCESFFHRVMGHTSPAYRKRCKKLGIFGKLVLRAWYSHCVIHHHMTFRHNYLLQFSSDEEEARLRNKLIAADKRHVLGQSYGLRVGPLGDYLLYVAPTLPVMLPTFWIGGIWFSIGAVFPLIAMPLMSEFVHPLMHLNHEEAIKAAPRILKPLVSSQYFRFAARHHWLHHRHPGVNFNTMLGGDYILGRHLSPTKEELAEMQAVGLCVRNCNLT